ncbi:MAG: sensor histidine kinase [Planctomycetota bacterium]
MPAPLEGPIRPSSLHALPGALLHCALLTVLTVAMVALTGWTDTEALLRPLFFALLYSFLRETGRRYPHIRGLPMRLCESGFLVLTLAAVGSAGLMLAGTGDADSWLSQLRVVLDRGAIFLLGIVLLAYGLLLWIPLVLESHRQLEASVARTRGELQESESARTSMERQLVDTHRLSILGELAAGIAHDLRNPLTIMKGAADALVRRARTPESTAEHAEIIRRGVEKADRTIQALIDLGRPRRSKAGPVPLADVAREALALVQVEGRRRHLRYVAEVGDAVVLADRDLLMQVLINLLLNATQSSPDKGPVDLRARRVGRGEGAAIAIVVEDRGQGLPPEVRHQLFTPFFTTRSGGTGLGLLSSRRIATEMGGNLGLYPRTRGGARALLVLPAAPPRGSTAAPGTAARERLQPSPPKVREAIATARAEVREPR